MSRGWSVERAYPDEGVFAALHVTRVARDLGNARMRECGNEVVVDDGAAPSHVPLHFLNRYRLRITIMICYLFF
mgnify:CR=1 FL=1